MVESFASDRHRRTPGTAAVAGITRVDEPVAPDGAAAHFDRAGRQFARGRINRPGCSRWETYPPRRTEELNVMN